jgi:hypothetical protein
MSRLPHLIDNRQTDGGKVVSLTRRPLLPPGKLLVLVRLEGIGKLKKKKANDLIGNRTPDLPACSIVPQPATLPRALI